MQEPRTEPMKPKHLKTSQRDGNRELQLMGRDPEVRLAWLREQTLQAMLGYGQNKLDQVIKTS